MDIMRISPFIQGVEHVLETMLQLPVEVRDPRWLDAGAAAHGVSVVAELGGDCQGSVCLGFESETAERMVALLTGRESASDSPDCADALCELLEMVCGSARSWLPDLVVAASIPTSECGANPMTARALNGAPVVVIPCVTDCGPFQIELLLEDGAEVADRDERSACAGA